MTTAIVISWWTQDNPFCVYHEQQKKILLASMNNTRMLFLRFVWFSQKESSCAYHECHNIKAQDMCCALMTISLCSGEKKKSKKPPAIFGTRNKQQQGDCWLLCLPGCWTVSHGFHIESSNPILCLMILWKPWPWIQGFDDMFGVETMCKCASKGCPKLREGTRVVSDILYLHGSWDYAQAQMRPEHTYHLPRSHEERFLQRWWLDAEWW